MDAQGRDHDILDHGYIDCLYPVRRVFDKDMKTRRHHNNKGLRQIKNGRTFRQVKCMAARLPEVKFIGEFNYQGQTHKLETKASTERSAWHNFCFGLAKQHGVQIGVMYNYFDGSKDNYHIKREV